MFIIVVFWFGV